MHSAASHVINNLLIVLRKIMAFVFQIYLVIPCDSNKIPCDSVIPPGDSMIPPGDSSDFESWWTPWPS